MESMDNGPDQPFAGIRLFRALAQKQQYYLDKASPLIKSRWLSLFILIALYTIRVYLIQGFYIVTYALGIYNLNLFLGFLTPQDDPMLDGPVLPSRIEEEFRPFVRRLPEFKFWYSSMKSFVYGMIATFIPPFDIPVFWPILLVYFIILLFLTLRRQIRHMLRHKYVPFDIGKRKYKGTKAPAKNST